MQVIQVFSRRKMIVDEKTILARQIEYQEKLHTAAQRRLIKNATQASVTDERSYHLGPNPVGQHLVRLAHDVSSTLQAVHTIIGFRGRENCEGC
jgi:hypothetical protein